MQTVHSLWACKGTFKIQNPRKWGDTRMSGGRGGREPQPQSLPSLPEGRQHCGHIPTRHMHSGVTCPRAEAPGSVPSRTQRIGEEQAQPPSSSSSSSLPSSPLGWAPKPPGTVKCHQGCVSDVLCMGCVVSPLFCVSLFRPPSGVRQRDGEDGGDGFGTYFSFSLTTGRG